MLELFLTFVSTPFGLAFFTIIIILLYGGIWCWFLSDQLPKFKKRKKKDEGASK